MNVKIEKPDMSPVKTPMPHSAPSDRIKNYNEIKLGYTPELARAEAGRCMNCPGRYCATKGCPINNPIPEMNQKIKEGDFEGAWALITANSPLPEVCSRICVQEHQCEFECSRGIKHEPVAIGALEQFVADNFTEKEDTLPAKEADKCKSVAIVGAGPAGLAAAWDLALNGFSVEVFERQEEAGGLLMYGIPNMKFDKNRMRKRIDLMKKLGITFTCNTEVGKDISTSELMTKYDALLLANGATDPRTLNVPGADAKGVVPAVTYLKASTLSLLDDSYTLAEEHSAKDKNVIIIGGGDTGTDCVATAIRQGAKSIRQFEILSKPAPKGTTEKLPWTNWPRELKIDYGHEEAIELFKEDPRIYDISTTEIITDADGKVAAIKTVNVQETKEHSCADIAGTEKEWPADLILLAMGFKGVETKVPQELGVTINGQGKIEADKFEFRTANEKVFACGDARRGQSLAIYGVAEGKDAAKSIAAYLEK